MAKKKEEKTNVMRILDQKKIPYTARFYEDSQGPQGTREYGVHVAQALGQDPAKGSASATPAPTRPTGRSERRANNLAKGDAARERLAAKRAARAAKREEGR